MQRFQDFCVINVGIPLFELVDIILITCYNCDISKIGKHGRLRPNGVIMISRKRILIIAGLLLAALFLCTQTCFAAKTSTINGVKYTHPSKYQSADYKVLLGVDVSYWQYDIDWDKVKKDGVDFAIIRIGYTGSDSFNQYLDSYALKNIKNAYAAGVNVGIYFWSEACTENEAKAEANWVIRQLKSYKSKITLPVAMDYEFASGHRSTKKFNSMTKTKARKQFTKNAKAFMDQIASAGYTPMFYSYRSLVDETFNSSGYKINMASILSKYKFWLAQYSTDNSYYGKFEIWQHTSSGTVKGISGRCDRDFWYYNENNETTESGTTSMKDCKVNLKYAQMKYTKKRLEPTVTVTKGKKTLTKGTDYQVLYFNNVKKGTAYAMVRGIGKYSNAVLKPFTIGKVNKLDPSEVAKNAVTPTSLTRPAVLKFKATWTPVTDADGYQIRYADNKAFKNSKTALSSKGTYSSKTVASKINATKLYVKMRCFALRDGKRVYGKYGAVKTVKIVNTPPAPENAKVKKTKKYKFKLTWTPVPTVSGYEIQYADNKKMKKKKAVLIEDATLSRKTIKSELKVDTVYTRIRAYIVVDGKKHFGAWSIKLSVKIK